MQRRSWVFYLSTISMTNPVCNDEAQAFKVHFGVFKQEHDCNCVLDDIIDSSLTDAELLDSFKNIPKKEIRNKLVLDEIVKILTPYNFALICSFFHSEQCYKDFVDSITDHLAVYKCVEVILHENFKLEIILDLLYEQNFFSVEERGKIECYKTFNSCNQKQTFFDVLKAKPVDDYDTFRVFMNCLSKNDVLRELELKVLERKGELLKSIVGCRLVSRNNCGLVSSSTEHSSKLKKSLSKYSVSSFLSESVLEDDFVLDQYYRYLRDRYVSLPNISLQGWHDSNINTKKFTDVTIIKSMQKGLKASFSSSATAILKREEEYSACKCKSYDEIFKFDNENDKLLILIEGNAGTGKTTFSHNICKKWSSKHMLDDYSFVILICLRNQKPGAIKEPKDLFISVGKTAGDIHTELSAHPTKKVLFWLEGWDELHDSYKVNSVFTQLLSGEVFPQAVVVVSTRPLATATLNSHKFVRKFHLVGFDKSQIERCARDYFFNYYHDHSDRDLILSNFVDQLDSVHGLAQLAEVPLNLAIILKLFVNQKALPNTLTNVYTDIVLVIFQHHQNRNYNNRKAITSVDDIHMQPAMTRILRGLEKHAYDTLLTQKAITFEEILVYISDPLEEKDFDGLGFFDIIEQESMTGESNSYVYRYKVIQEYFAAVYLTRLKTEEQKQELTAIFGKANYEMVWIFYAGITGMTRVHIQSVFPKLNLPLQSNVTLPLHTRRDLYTTWMQCHRHFMDMTNNNEFSVDFLLTLMLCCYEAKIPEACKIIADFYYPNNICRIEIPPNRATPYLLLAVSYFIAHSGKQWSLRCTSAIPSGVALVCKFISDPKFIVSGDDSGGLWIWCFVLKPPDIDAYIKAINSQTYLQWIHLLNGSYLDDECTSKLCECLKFDRKIIRVELENYGIGSVGLKSIGNVLKVNQKILHLDIRKNNFILDDVIEFLITIKKKTNIEHLLVDEEYSSNTQVCEILLDINVKRKQTGQISLDIVHY